jgi:hypothetical protein
MSHLFEHLLHGSETTTRERGGVATYLDEIGDTNACELRGHVLLLNASREHTDTAIEQLVTGSQPDVPGGVRPSRRWSSAVRRGIDDRTSNSSI